MQALIERLELKVVLGAGPVGLARLWLYVPMAGEGVKALVKQPLARLRIVLLDQLARCRAGSPAAGR